MDKNNDMAALNFTDLHISPTLLSALEKMKIEKPTAIQTQGIPLVLNGSNLIAIAETGSGKTLTYALAIMTLLEKKTETRALIMAPSREMVQQLDLVFTKLREALPMTSCLVIGGQDGSKQTSQLKKNPRIILATPGRMNDHLQTNKLLLQKVEFVVIDEAERMLDMGFAPQLKNIQKTMRGQWQTLMFSASMSPAVETVAKIFMQGEPQILRTNQSQTPVETLKQKVIYLSSSQKNDQLFEEIKDTKGGVIVFAGDQESCVKVGKHLAEFDLDSDLIHGGLSQGHRNRVIREFREGKIRVLVTTDLLARGLDVPHVNLVVNYDLPVDPDDFLHRIGRTARAGKYGEAITFITAADAKMQKRIQKYLVGAKEIKLEPLK